MHYSCMTHCSVCCITGLLQSPHSMHQYATNLCPATIRQLTDCQGKNAPSASAQSASFQLQPPSDNLPTVKARMPQVHQHSQLHSSSSHHQTTYILSRQECPKSLPIEVEQTIALPWYAETMLQCLSASYCKSVPKTAMTLHVLL